MQKVLIIGCGVIGLSTAIRLLESCENIQVTIWTEKLTPNTTSDIAGAIWGPYHVEPQQLSDEWAFVSLKRFNSIACETIPLESGVYNASGIVYDTSMELPTWLRDHKSLFQYKTILSHNHQQYCNIYELTLPMIDSSVYLKYLERKYYELGGKSIMIKRVDSLKDISTFENMFQIKFDMIINCTGYGSRKLFNDRNVVADVGQLVHIQLPSDKDILGGKFYDAVPLDKEGQKPTYILPRTNNTYVLGGTSKIISDKEMESDTNTLCATSAMEILKRCDQLLPHAKILSDAKVLEYKVGWRPFRKNGIRFELEQNPRPIIHCYGFGGGGTTLSWGAADAVVNLLNKYRSNSNLSSRL
jgi:D-amino-acid oxidase